MKDLFVRITEPFDDFYRSWEKIINPMTLVRHCKSMGLKKEVLQRLDSMAKQQMVDIHSHTEEGRNLIIEVANKHIGQSTLSDEEFAELNEKAWAHTYVSELDAAKACCKMIRRGVKSQVDCIYEKTKSDNPYIWFTGGFSSFKHAWLECQNPIDMINLSESIFDHPEKEEIKDIICDIPLKILSNEVAPMFIEILNGLVPQGENSMLDISKLIENTGPSLKDKLSGICDELRQKLGTRVFNQYHKYLENEK